MRGIAGVLRVCAVVAAVALIGGCGTEAASPGGVVPATPTVPAFPATLNPDGTVPWVSAPAVAPVPSPPPPTTGPPCTAGQLRAELPTWVRGQQTNDGGMAPLTAASLYGYVILTNTSARLCTLAGVPAVTLTSHGIPVNVSYGMFGTGEAAKAGLPPHRTANFRIDWGAPYCPHGTAPGAPQDKGPFGLRLTVDGLSLQAAVHSTASPGCVDGGGGGQSSVVTSPVQPGSIIPGTPPAGASSPLRRLKATVSGYPLHIAPGQLLKFVVALANPTRAPVSLVTTPPPSYDVEAFCLGNATRGGFSFARTYSLDTGPRPVVPAHGSVRFAMQVAIPAAGCPTSQLTISWTFPVYVPESTFARFTTTLAR